MPKLPRSIAARLALGYGLLVASALAVLAVVFYFGTIGTFDRTIDAKINRIDGRLRALYAQQSPAGLAREIDRLLADGIDSDTEIYLLTDAHGKVLAGNLAARPQAKPHGRLFDTSVVRDGRATRARLLDSALGDGGFLVVGRDLSDRNAIRAMVWRSLTAGAVLVLLLSAGGAFWFRRRLEARIAAIRLTAREIEAGDLSQRIRVPEQARGDDEFDRLTADINRMLDRIEHLVDGVRHVSNAIAHDLRTPLNRVRNRLAESARAPDAALRDAVEDSIARIDELTALFEKLLQIAEAESGVQPASFTAIDLQAIARDLVELYEASAEDRKVSLVLTGAAAVPATGDRNLIASALDNLIDNALKYAVAGARIEVGAFANECGANLVVRDYGPGIPDTELARVRERFYRLDRSRHLPGNGLGLSSAVAIATLHRGTLVLENANPGLRVRMTLPLRANPILSKS